MANVLGLPKGRSRGLGQVGRLERGGARRTMLRDADLRQSDATRAPRSRVVRVSPSALGTSLERSEAAKAVSRQKVAEMIAGRVDRSRWLAPPGEQTRGAR